MAVVGVLVMSSLSSFADIATFTVYPSNQCEKGALQYTRSGNFGMCFFPSGYYIEPTEVNYWGTHYLEIRDASNQVVYSNSTAFNVSASVTTIDGGFCAYKSFASTLPSNQMSNIIGNLDPGTYYAYIWTDYFWWYFAGGIMSFDNNTEGSSAWPNHVGSVTITEEHLTHPIVLEKTEVTYKEKDAYYIYNCDMNNSIDFHLDKVTPLLGNLYTVTSEWAEVTDCEDTPSNFSLPKLSSLFILYTNFPDDQVLRLGNIRSSAVLEDNPFDNDANLGKMYKLRFTISNGVCDTEEVTITVIFSRNTSDMDFKIFKCVNGSFPAHCSSEGFVDFTDSAPGPMMPLGIPLLQIGDEETVITGYAVFLKDTESDECIGAFYIDEDDDEYTSLSLSESYCLGNKTIAVHMESHWPLGTTFSDLANAGVTKFKLEIFPINGCNNCMKYDEEEKMMVKVKCSTIKPYMNCDYFIDKEFIELSKILNQTGEFTATGPIYKTNFQINSSILFKPSLNNDNAISPNITELSLYPNPFSNELLIDNPFEKSEAVLMNLEGKVVKNISLLPMQKNTINTSDLSSGMYILQHTSSDTSRSYRVIKF